VPWSIFAVFVVLITSQTKGAIKISQYSGEQIVRILREADKAPIVEIAKRLGMNEKTTKSGLKRRLQPV
jgi:ActR/RegA family two-component response regulator